LTLWQLGLIHFELGDAQEAVDLLRQAVSQFKETGDRTLMARALIDLGVVLRASDSPSESEHVLLKAFQIAAELQSFSIACQALGEMAWSEMEQGRMERALELVTFVLVNAETNREAKQCAGQLKANLEALLPPEKIVAVQAQAQAKALADFVHELSGNPVLVGVLVNRENLSNSWVKSLLKSIGILLRIAFSIPAKEEIIMTEINRHKFHHCSFRSTQAPGCVCRHVEYSRRNESQPLWSSRQDHRNGYL
jgi:tetratricopeptide (TPR) repeat protein